MVYDTVGLLFNHKKKQLIQGTTWMNVKTVC